MNSATAGDPTPHASSVPALALAVRQIDAAVLAGEMTAVPRILNQNAWNLVAEDPDQLGSILERIDAEALRDYPLLQLLKRYLLPVIDRPARARLLTVRPIDTRESAQLSPADQTWSLLQRMIAHRLRSEIDEAQEIGARLRVHLERVTPRGDDGPLPMIAAVHVHLGTTEMLSGHLDRAVEDYATAAAAARGQFGALTRDALSKSACVLATEGRLLAAEALLADAAEIAVTANGYSTRVLAREALARAIIAVERMDLDAATMLADLDRDILMEYWPLIALAESRWALATGNSAGALEILDSASNEHPVPSGSLAEQVVVAMRAKALEVMGMPRVDGADVELTRLPVLEALVVVRSAIYTADTRVSVALAQELAARHGLGPSVRVEALLLAAWAGERVGGQVDERLLSAAGALIEQQGLWRPLSVVPRYLRDRVPVSVPDYVRHTTIAAPTSAAQLTPRERDVLWMLCGQGSLAEIADEMHVSVNTVKTQVQSLYRRLGVSSRQDAVNEALRRRLVPRR